MVRRLVIYSRFTRTKRRQDVRGQNTSDTVEFLSAFAIDTQVLVALTAAASDRGAFSTLLLRLGAALAMEMANKRPVKRAWKGLKERKECMIVRAQTAG